MAEKNYAYSKVGNETNLFRLSGYVRFPINSLTTTKDKKPFVSLLITQYRMAGTPGNQKEFSKTFQVLCFDEQLVDKFRAISEQVRVEVYGNVGVKVSTYAGKNISSASLIATDIQILETLGIPFERSGKPKPLGQAIKERDEKVMDDEIKVLEAKAKATLKDSVAEPLLETDDDLPF
jgi:hypothetical protein